MYEINSDTGRGIVTAPRNKIDPRHALALDGARKVGTCTIFQLHPTTLPHMNKDRIIAALNAATEMHDQIDGAVSLDMLFLAAYLDQPPQQQQKQQRRAYGKRQADSIPVEFQETVQAWTGQSYTASHIFELSYQREPERAEARQAGAWLRAMGKTPRKSGGRILFDL